MIPVLFVMGTLALSLGAITYAGAWRAPSDVRAWEVKREARAAWTLVAYGLLADAVAFLAWLLS